MAAVSSEDISYRQGKLDDIQLFFETCYGLGWPVTYEMMENVFVSCPEAFSVAENNGAVIGRCMGDILNDDEAFVSFFVVDEKYQRQGIGGALFRRCLEALGDRNVTLYATPQGAPYYKKHFGFKPATEKPRMACLASFTLELSEIANIDTDSSFKLVPLKDVSLDSLEEYDTKIHVVNRRIHLQKLENLMRGVVGMVDNQIVGYGCLAVRNLAGKSYLLGPVLADTPQYAEALVKELISKLPDGSNVVVIYLEGNKDAVALMNKFGVKSAVPVEVLYTKHAVDVAVEKVYSMESAANAFA